MVSSQHVDIYRLRFKELTQTSNDLFDGLCRSESWTVFGMLAVRHHAFVLHDSALCFVVLGVFYRYAAFDLVKATNGAEDVLLIYIEIITSVINENLIV